MALAEVAEQVFRTRAVQRDVPQFLHHDQIAPADVILQAGGLLLLLRFGVRIGQGRGG